MLRSEGQTQLLDGSGLSAVPNAIMMQRSPASSMQALMIRSCEVQHRLGLKDLTAGRTEHKSACRA